MKVLITGGAGFIGSHLAERILAQGDEVLVIDNFLTGRRDNLKEHNSLELREFSIAERDKVFKAFDDFTPDVVIHAAASYKDPENWLEDSLTNVAGTANIVQASQAAQVKKIIYFQTALCYGLNPEEQPITLDHHIESGNSSYAISKTAGEQYVALSGLNHVIFRLANAYGPRNMSGPLPTFFHRLSTGKPCFVMDTRRDFIFIEDLADVVMKSVNGEGGTGAYHISSGSDYSIKQLFDEVVKALDIKLEEDVEVRPRHADDAFTILLDPSRMQNDFAYIINTPLEEGVRRAVEYYKEYGISETYTHLKQLKK
ncbi:NAD-dependent epimerase/dehydratase family protein [Limisalsivibrio acetivorans]|uniref:NAD-dependent epimerase/dehydratase family protein n=1 Tax=Limisalsivibrio acetivorans TaxID=1304888 RepID=UPI0003B55C71|nr:NAD-dependent epimerase/dehydratase family protein [Limisalsivibrio acetivorans]